jgi:anthranilate synthase component 1
VVRIFGARIEVWNDGECTEALDSADPLQWVDAFQQRFRVARPDGMPRFAGGLVGYFGYDTVRYVESRLSGCNRPDPLGTPDILLMVSDEVVVFDNLGGKLQMIVNADAEETGAWDAAQSRLDELMEQLRRPVTIPGALQGARQVGETDFVSGFAEADFKAAVRRVQEYIVEGDAMQVVLSQRLSIPYQAPPLDLYRALRSLNPSPYMFYLDLDRRFLAGNPGASGRWHDYGTSHRGHAPARARRGRGSRARRRLAGGPQGARRAPDADRSRA